jgi:predicted dehydrogenase/acetyltransferase-like isoleucine patch superfamily enzyme
VTTRVAVIGAGYWGRNLVRNFATLGCLAAVADASPATAAAQAAEHGVPVRSLEEILADDAIDAVAIAVPAAQHHEVAAAALDGGKHVFVEKPLSLVVEDAEDLCKRAEASEATLMVGHLLHYHPAFLEMQRMADEGVLGRVQYLYSNRLNLGRIRREEDILWSFAPHDISMILALVRAEPDVVWAVGARYLHQSIADVTTTHLAFPGGERAHVFVSWLHPFKEQKLVVVGDRGMAVFDDGQPWEHKLTIYRHQIAWHEGLPDPVRADAEPIPLETAEPLRVECEHFLECIRTGAKPRTDGWEGLRVLKVLARAGASLAEDGLQQPAPAAGGPVSTPPHVTVPTHEVAPPRLPPSVHVHESSYIDDDVEIGDGTTIWHFSHLLGGSRIGRSCSLGQNVMIGPDVVVGDGCRIQNNVSVYAGVTLGDGVFCGPSCVFTNVTNPRAEVDRKQEFRPTDVGRGASIGANATIVCGNRIGAWSMIGAGAVVTSDVPDHGLMVGVPARRVGWVSHDGEILGDDLVCPRSGRAYREVSDDRLEEIR